MNQPTRTEIIDLAAKHFGIDRREVIAIMKTPTHPEGMRDTFAAVALPGYIVANPECQDDKLARLAYGTADAMLLERAK